MSNEPVRLRCKRGHEYLVPLIEYKAAKVKPPCPICARDGRPDD